MVHPVLSPNRVGVTDAQAGLPAKGSGSAFPVQRVARGTSGSWSPAAGVPAAHSRRRVRGGLSPPSRAGNRAFGRTCPNAPVSGLPQPRGCERLRKVECSRCSGQRPETFIDTTPSGGVDSRPFPGIRKGFGCVALHRRIGGATGLAALRLPRSAILAGRRLYRASPFRGEALRIEVQKCTS